MTNIFEGMTNLYEITKTLRFELKPIGKTKDLLEENHIIELDKERQLSYEKVKPYFNKLHLDFINKSLENPLLEFESFEKSYKDWIKDKKNTKLIKNKDNEARILRQKIETLFDAQAKKYLEYYEEISFNNKNKEFLYEVSVFEILKQKFGHISETQTIDPKTSKVISIFDNWNGRLGYFTKFFNTRKNFYKSDGTSTALATRIIDHNLTIFIENMVIFERVKDIILFSHIENDFSKKVEEIFNIKFYNLCCLQNGIDNYNKIIGGETTENGKKLKGLNEYINKYKQDSGNKLPFFKKLQKQILSEKKQNFIQQIESVQEFEEVLRDFYNNSKEKVKHLQKLCDSIGRLESEQYKSIYLNKTAFSTLSHKFANNIQQLEKILYEAMKNDKIISIKYDKKEDKYTFPDFISLQYIKIVLENYHTEELFWKERYYISENKKIGFLERTTTNLWQEFCKIFKFEFEQMLSRDIITECGETLTIGYTVSQEKLQKVLEKTFEITEYNRGIIKDFADYTKTLYNFGKYFALEKGREWDNNFNLDDEFYKGENGYLEKFYDNAYEDIVVPYNLMRNYIAKKPWSDAKKWKINFESSSFLSGWDKEIETNGSYIFRRNEKYYLGVINGSNPTISQIEKLYTSGTQSIERFIYDFQKPDNKNIPRTFIRSKGNNFAPAVEKYNLPVDDILEIYDNGLFKTENRENTNYKSSLTKMIDYFKLGLSRHDSYKHYHFVWKESSQYNNIAEFYRDAEKSCYKPSWEILNYDALLELVENRKLYLFQIYNKDFKLDESLQYDKYSFKGAGQKNMHTLYFESLFQKENMENQGGATMKLSGGGEVFFRPKAIEKKYEKRKFSRDIIINKRYTETKMFLHFPMQLNFKENVGSSFNQKINTFLSNNPNINVIGIDRGEKHLAYFSVINQKSEILESGTLNHITDYDVHENALMRAEKKLSEKRDEEGTIIEYVLEETGNQVPYTDYALLLEVKEKNRRLQRQSWKEIEQIKDLKKGYIAAVVKKIADLIIKHNAIVIFEDLNMRFKQIRGGIEKSAYQQLEKALIDKLNFLVDKNEMDPAKAGHILKAYQLTAPVEAFKDMGKQTGIIFYTQASYTSKIDPVTGWRPHLYLKKQNAEENKEMILKFNSIIFNKEKKRFEITYDLKKFATSENTQFPTKTVWTICSCIERFKWNKNLNNNKGGYENYKDLTDNFKSLFERYNINILNNILEQIKTLSIQGNEKFFSDFIDYFLLINQIRNTNESIKGHENDFILSPVEPFFDSRKENSIGIKNGDDNGAYNIARKGIIILNRISEWKSQNEVLKKKGEKEALSPDLFISNITWDNHTTDN